VNLLLKIYAKGKSDMTREVFCGIIEIIRRKTMSKLIPSRITSLREYKGLSQAEFAKLAQIEQSYVSKLERGRAPNVAGIVLARIASVLETSVDYLLNLTNDPVSHPFVDPPLDDPTFARLTEHYLALDDEGRKALLFIAERMAAAVERRG
jgi:transcriptional regulator with XRE-family HTH domain